MVLVDEVDSGLPASRQAYIDETITPTLSRGLVALCRARPDHPVQWLAEWLQQNKPTPTAMPKAVELKCLVLYASDTPDKADFVGMLKPSVIALEYDVETTTCANLIALIFTAVSVNGGRFASVGVAHHSVDPASGDVWAMSKAVRVKHAASIGEDVSLVLHALGDATIDGGRVDLFTCSLLKTAEGRAFFDAVQSATAAHFAASDDLTGNAKGKGQQDWIMESDQTDIAPLYFSADAMTDFEGNFGATLDEEFERKSWLQIQESLAPGLKVDPPPKMPSEKDMMDPLWVPGPFSPECGFHRGL